MQPAQPSSCGSLQRIPIAGKTEMTDPQGPTFPLQTSTILATGEPLMLAGLKTTIDSCLEFTQWYCFREEAHTGSHNPLPPPPVPRAPDQSSCSVAPFEEPTPTRLHLALEPNRLCMHLHIPGAPTDILPMSTQKTGLT